MTRLSAGFYQSEDVVAVARALIGKLLVSKLQGITTSGLITETEAYHESEKACHAYRGRRTERTEVLFKAGGISYVYLCYGIHCLLNVTTGKRGEAAAVLIRAIEPDQGLDYMIKRRNLNGAYPRVSAGPGMLTQALGVTLKENGKSLVTGKHLWIESNTSFPETQVAASSRIGVDYAGDDAQLPWRFYLKNSRWVSKI